MIQTLKTERGYVYAYIEYSIVNAQGQFQDLGEYCFIHHLWIHPEYRTTNSHVRKIGELIQKVNEDKFMANVRFVYWLRERRNGRQVIFPRTRLAKIGENHGRRKIITSNS